MPNMVQLFFNGLGLSAFYALFAVGLTLVFGTMKIINFAHGELYMVGAYLVYFVLIAGSDFLPALPLFLLGLVVALLAVSILSIAIERALFRPLRKSPFAVFIASLGLLYILQVLAGQIFGMKQKMAPVVFPWIFNFGGTVLSSHVGVTILAAFILIGSLWFFLSRTRLGRGVRASSQDNEAAALQGISINKMSVLVMGIGGALAAAAGAIVGTSLMLTPYMGWSVLWKAFIITIVGGMGSVGGAVIASLLFGFLDNLVTAIGEPQSVIMIDVLIMLLILAWRPQGLLGREK